jgi:hypothetical protein
LGGEYYKKGPKQESKTILDEQLSSYGWDIEPGRMEAFNRTEGQSRR